jgi:hypothetical protein
VEQEEPGGALRARFPEQVDEVLEAGAGFVAAEDGFRASSRRPVASLRIAAKTHQEDCLRRVDEGAALAARRFTSTE